MFQELRRRGCETFTWSQPDYEVDFVVREGRRVARLIQVCEAVDTPAAITREYRALHKAAAATRCRKLLLLTPDGVEPPARLRPKGPKVEVKAVWNWLLG